VRLHIVRHAHAGARSRWNGDDRLRPLSRRGEQQAAAVAAMLADSGARRLVSSPYIRCIETLRPMVETIEVPSVTGRLARHGRAVGAPEGAPAPAFDGDAGGPVQLEVDDRLAEGAGFDAAWSLLEELRSRQQTAVLCSHGDIISVLLESLAARGVRFDHGLTWPKGSTWVVATDDGGWSEARYTAPPAA
jgi:broad specificity phosphatase PhoE